MTRSTSEQQDDKPKDPHRGTDGTKSVLIDPTTGDPAAGPGNSRGGHGKPKRPRKAS